METVQFQSLHPQHTIYIQMLSRFYSVVQMIRCILSIPFWLSRMLILSSIWRYQGWLCGHWIHNGTKNTKITVWKRNGAVAQVLSTSTSVKSPPDENSKRFTMARVYYTKDPHSGFKRTYYYFHGNQKLLSLSTEYYPRFWWRVGLVTSMCAPR